MNENVRSRQIRNAHTTSGLLSLFIQTSKSDDAVGLAEKSSAQQKSKTDRHSTGDLTELHAVSFAARHTRFNADTQVYERGLASSQKQQEK